MSQWYDLERWRHHQLDYFLMMFPPVELTLVCWLTNSQLGWNTKAYISMSEILEFIGVFTLAMNFELGNHASLWSTVSQNKYVPPARFRKTVMSQIESMTCGQTFIGLISQVSDQQR